MFKSSPNRIGYGNSIPDVMYYGGKALEENLKTSDYNSNSSNREVYLPPIKLKSCKEAIPVV